MTDGYHGRPEICEHLGGNPGRVEALDGSFHEHACGLIATPPAAARKLCFEIAEGAAIAHLADAAVFAADMRALGVRIALGEFGACASSFGHLKTLAVDYLKIDGRFIRDLLDDPLDHAAVRSFREVAKVIGAKTIADAVERGDTLAELKRIGIDHAQGDLIHRAQPLEEVLCGAAVMA